VVVEHEAAEREDGEDDAELDARTRQKRRDCIITG
jgi:hypothetical protein